MSGRRDKVQNMRAGAIYTAHPVFTLLKIKQPMHGILHCGSSVQAGSRVDLEGENKNAQIYAAHDPWEKQKISNGREHTASRPYAPDAKSTQACRPM